jgi:hypothetical protein
MIFLYVVKPFLYVIMFSGIYGHIVLLPVWCLSGLFVVWSSGIFYDIGFFADVSLMTNFWGTFS